MNSLRLSALYSLQGCHYIPWRPLPSAENHLFLVTSVRKGLLGTSVFPQHGWQGPSPCSLKNLPMSHSRPLLLGSVGPMLPVLSWRWLFVQADLVTEFSLVTFMFFPEVLLFLIGCIRCGVLVYLLCTQNGLLQSTDSLLGNCYYSVGISHLNPAIVRVCWCFLLSLLSFSFVSPI